MACARTADFALTEDRMLAAFARGGDDRALAELFHRYEAVIKLRASQASFTGLEQEDLVQEGMIGLFSAVQSYRAEGGASFRTYALLCIRRRILSAAKSASRKKHIPLNNYVSLDDEANAQSAALTNVINPEDMIVCRENIGALKDVVEKRLTTLERGILSLYVSGITYAGIAQVFHVSIKSVDNSLQKIRKKLLVSIKG